MLLTAHEQWLDDVNQCLDQLLEVRELPYKELFHAARYSTLNSGKRIRPLLAMTTAEMLGADVSLALQPACAVELIHTYSLVHDDIPCMDDDDLRRGKPTLHRVYPEGVAVLAGDFLLTYAFEVLADSPGLMPMQKILLVKILARRAGAHGMVGGQMLDISLDAENIDLPALQVIHRLKTAALITACLEIGGIIANASEEDMECLRKVGQELGLAFQIVDDMLDIAGDEETLGKPIGSDIANNKVTYVSLLGMDRSHDAAQQLLTSAAETLHQLPGDPTRLLTLARLVLDRIA